MRLKSNIITIVYAGEEILAPGEHIFGQEYGGSRSFTTSADSILEAGSPEIRAFGNAQGIITVNVSLDFQAEDAALDEAMRRLDFAETHQTGELKLTIGSKSRSWLAGIDSIDWQQSYMPDCVRLVVSYSFILGAVI